MTQPKKLFTTDSDDAQPVEMPSVTKLLNRKKLGLSTTSNSSSQEKPSQSPKLAPAPVASAPAFGQQPQIQQVKSRRTQAKKTPPLSQWSLEGLQGASDSFQKAVFYLIQKGARQVLLLTPSKSVAIPKPGTRFVAHLAYKPDDKEPLWRGLTLDPSLVQDVWEQLSSRGIVEIIPTLSLSSQTDSSGFLKKAFGLAESDWLVLVRCGSPQACTGVLALVSSSSISKEIAQAFQVQKPLKKAA